MQRAKQYHVFREQLLRWEKTASDCDRCSVMVEAVRFAIGLLWELNGLFDRSWGGFLCDILIRVLIECEHLAREEKLGRKNWVGKIQCEHLARGKELLAGKNCSRKKSKLAASGTLALFREEGKFKVGRERDARTVYQSWLCSRRPAKARTCSSSSSDASDRNNGTAPGFSG